MGKLKRYAIEILKRIVFVLIPLAIALDPIQKWTNNKLLTSAIMVTYTYVSLVVIRWLSSRRVKKLKS